jgi:hypothetical protein
LCPAAIAATFANNSALSQRRFALIWRVQHFPNQQESQVKTLRNLCIGAAAGCRHDGGGRREHQKEEKHQHDGR